MYARFEIASDDVEGLIADNRLVGDPSLVFNQQLQRDLSNPSSVAAGPGAATYEIPPPQADTPPKEAMLLIAPIAAERTVVYIFASDF